MIYEHHFIDVLFRRTLKLIHTLCIYLMCEIWKINIGRKCTFIGLIRLRRLPDTKIIIGNECHFFSRSNSNLIGVNRPCMISTLAKGAKITIGNNSGFSGTVIGAFQNVIIGNHVKCGANTLITDSDWHPEDWRSGNPSPVILEDNVWLGEGVKVLKGVTIGENSLIGAGSVVVKSIPANVIAAGNPCKVIRSIEK